MLSSPLPFYFVPPRTKYSPQNHILKHPHPKFFPHYDRPSFVPIQSNRQNYSPVYSSVYNFWVAKWKTIQFAPSDSQHFLSSVCS